MRLKVRLSDGAVVSRDVDKHGNSVAVLPYSIERRCALVAHLFRAPIFEATGEEISEEACAGMIMNESAVETAHRESLEELGVIIHDLDFVAKVWDQSRHLNRTAIIVLGKLPSFRSRGSWRRSSWRARRNSRV